MKETLLAFSASVVIALSAYAASPTLTPADGYPDFAMGADVSWTPYIESNHLHTYYKNTDITASNITNIEDMVSDYGIDAVRLRVWVDPDAKMAKSGFKFTVSGYSYDVMSTYGTCSVEQMVTLAGRFAKRGQRVMVVFQMSDTWADPARQFIPESWASCSTTDMLADKAAAHVTEALTLLHEANVNVAWVQIGNEVNTGMLKYQLPAASGNKVTSVSWGCEVSQKSSNVPSETTKNFVKVFAKAAAAAKEIYPDTKIVLHLAKTDDWTSLNWSLNMLRRAGLSQEMCDYVGLSLYPGIDDGQQDYTAKWKTYATKGLTSIKNVYNNYGWRTLLCEMGMNNEYSLSANMTGVSKANEQGAYIAQCNTDVRAFTQYLIDNLATGSSTCDGFFYWEPETDYMHNYKMGACVSATPGASWPRDKVTANQWWYTVKEHSSFPAGGLIDYTAGANSITDINVDDAEAKYYDLMGRPVMSPTPGLYILRVGNAATKVLIR